MQILNKQTGSYSISGNCNYAWSASKNNFFLLSDLLVYVRNGNWPEDAVEVTDAVFSEFASFQNSEGKIRGAGADGLPVWVDKPKKSQAELVRDALSRRTALIAEAAQQIDILTDAETNGSITEEEQYLLIQWRDYRLALYRLDLNAAPDIDWPEVPGDVA